ncbi:unnamed protein product [Zymoseptoria tritici ST99CH_1A5]|uniref:Uncharacterized protein n=1 Tax=Zymoseptoria tritici ST99CH_1A5 TaxID=1276529 RepID=A0A1Y6M167_ZYMTR|nr:unnamed protein product [Zymoseptoria tritici ST99CH_1A5]
MDPNTPSGVSLLSEMVTSELERMDIGDLNDTQRSAVEKLLREIEDEDNQDAELSGEEPETNEEDPDADPEDEDVDNDEEELLPGQERTAKEKRIFQLKFKNVMKAVRDARFGGFEALLRHWTRADKLQYRSATYRRRVRRIQSVLWREKLVSTKQIRSELKKLVSMPIFDKYKPENSMKQVELNEINEIIRKTAPTWYAMINDELLPNDRANWAEVKQRFKNKYDLIAKRSVIMTTTVVHSIAKQRANWMPKALGLLLVTGGVKSRLISVLNRAGLVSGFKTLQALQESNADEHIRAVVEMAKDPQVLIAYDNFCRQEQKNEQVVGQKNEQKNMTTSLIAKCQYIHKNINKGMVNWKTPLLAKSIIRNLGSRDTVGDILARGKQSAKHLAAQDTQADA